MQVPMPQMMNMGMVGGGIMGMGFNPATGTLQPQQQQQPGINANVNVSNSNSGIGAIPAHERVAYDALFHQTTTGKPLSGELARGLFSQSGLPVDVLAKIWDLSDIDKDGMLDREEFSIACYLTRLGVQRIPMPDVLPKALVPESKLLHYNQTSFTESNWTTFSVDKSLGAPVVSTDWVSFGDSSFSQPMQQTQPQIPASQVTFSGGTFIPQKDSAISRYTLPQASFEQRVSFQGDLDEALKGRKKD